MAETVATIAEKAARLTPRQRIKLISKLCQSLADNELPPLTDSQKSELDARHSRFRADPSRARPSEQSIKSVAAELKRRNAARGSRG